MSVSYWAAKQGSMGQLGLQGWMPGLKQARVWAENDLNETKNMISWVGTVFLQVLRVVISTGKECGEM